MGGSEAASTQRSRQCRERKALQCNINATPCNTLQQNGNVEIEIEIEIDKEKDIYKYIMPGGKNLRAEGVHNPLLPDPVLSMSLLTI